VRAGEAAEESAKNQLANDYQASKSAVEICRTEH